MLYLSGIRSSYNLFNAAYAGVMSTSVAWFDATPVSLSLGLDQRIQ